MKRKSGFSFLILFVFAFLVFQPVWAGSEYSDRLIKTLGVTKKTGSEDLEQQRHAGQLMITLSSMSNANTALSMYYTDHGRYPQSLNMLTPNYLRTVPKGISSKGDVLFTYESKNSGKSYVIYCKGTNFPQLNVPADYPKSETEKGNMADVYLKPGVVKPPYNARQTAENSAAKNEFHSCLMQIPDLVKKKDPAQAKKVRLKLSSLMNSNQLNEQEKSIACDVIKTCERIESGKAK